MAQFVAKVKDTVAIQHTKPYLVTVIYIYIYIFIGIRILTLLQVKRTHTGQIEKTLLDRNWDSNPRLSVYWSDLLPTELQGQAERKPWDDDISV